MERLDPHLYRSLFLASPDALLVANEAGRIVLANRNAASLLGYAVDELVGMDIEALVPDDVRARHAQYRAAYARTPQSRPMGTRTNLVARRRDGREVMVEIALSPLESAGASLVVAAIRDIEAYPRMQQALRRARYSDHLAQFGRLAVDARDTSLLLRDVPALAVRALEIECAAIYLLESAKHAFAVAAQIGLPRLAGAHVANDDASMIGCALRSRKPVTLAHPGDADRPLPAGYDGLDLASGLLVPVYDRGDAIGLIAVHSRSAGRFGDDEIRFIESLSSLLSTSLQRAQTEEALTHAQRLEAVGELTGGIAHDFNNLLTIVQGNLQILGETTPVADDAETAQLVAAATRATQRAADLTRKLLAFSRRQRLRPGAVDVAQLVASLIDMLGRTFDARIRVALRCDRAVPLVLADPAQLEAAVLNIAINARDAMPDGGTLGIRLDHVARLPPGPAVDATDAVANAGGYVAIVVEDSGTGMNEDVRERAFEPFFTTKPVGKGTGLGLSTVYGFARQSYGAVTLDSAPGAGTRVALYLPVAPPDDVAALVASADASPLAGLRVLLVEDEADVREVTVRFLARLGCKIDTADNGEAALAVLAARDDLQLLLTDLSLGAGIRGDELARRAQRTDPGLRVLLVSGYPSELLDADANAPPDWELLQKPYTREDLEHAIRRVVANAG